MAYFETMNEYSDNIRLFISYRNKDQYLALMLKKNLESLGLEVFVDKDNLPAGAGDWQFEIQKAISNSDILLLLVSYNTFSDSKLQNIINVGNTSKDIVIFEVECALQNSKPIITIWTDINKYSYPQNWMTNRHTEQFMNRLEKNQAIEMNVDQIEKIIAEKLPNYNNIKYSASTQSSPHDELPTLYMSWIQPKFVIAFIVILILIMLTWGVSQVSIIAN